MFLALKILIFFIDKNTPRSYNGYHDPNQEIIIQINRHHNFMIKYIVLSFNFFLKKDKIMSLNKY